MGEGTYLPRLCLNIRFTSQVSSFVSQEILYEEHQASLSTMVDSNHVPNTLVKKDLPASDNFKLNIPNGMTSYQIKRKLAMTQQRYVTLGISSLISIEQNRTTSLDFVLSSNEMAHNFLVSPIPN